MGGLVVVSAWATIRSQLSFDELAGVLSAKIAGNLPFSGKDEMYESPALFTEIPLLGLQLILIEGEDLHALKVTQHESFDEVPCAADKYMDLSEYLIALLNTIDGVEAFESPPDA
jgi:hypothetical protein